MSLQLSKAQTLPNELLFRVFSYLHDTSAAFFDVNADLFSCALVCKNWQHEAENVLYGDLHISWTYWKSSMLPIERIKRLGSVRSLSVAKAAVDYMVLETSPLLPKWPLRVTSLSEALWELVASCKGLRHLSIDNPFPNSIQFDVELPPELFPALAMLEMLELRSFGPAAVFACGKDAGLCFCIQHVLRACPNLHSLVLNLTSTRNFENHCEVLFVSFPPNLRRLSLIGEYKMNDSATLPSYPFFTSLRDLAIDSSLLTSAFLQLLPTLSVENLSIPCWPNNDVLQYLPPSIQTISIKFRAPCDLAKLTRTILRPILTTVFKWTSSPEYDLPHLKCVLVKLMEAFQKRGPGNGPEMQPGFWRDVQSWQAMGTNVGLHLWLGVDGGEPSPYWFEGCWQI
ncbi:hypothetical protein T439DRAFT_348991 [Meredithblackwellia eburnea MCA 4105]